MDECWNLYPIMFSGAYIRVPDIFLRSKHKGDKVPYNINYLKKGTRKNDDYEEKNKVSSSSLPCSIIIHPYTLCIRYCRRTFLNSDFMPLC